MKILGILFFNHYQLVFAFLVTTRESDYGFITEPIVQAAIIYFFEQGRQVYDYLVSIDAENSTDQTPELLLGQIS
jgi:hypothetical protein